MGSPCFLILPNVGITDLQMYLNLLRLFVGATWFFVLFFVFCTVQEQTPKYQPAQLAEEVISRSSSFILNKEKHFSFKYARPWKGIGTVNISLIS